MDMQGQNGFVTPFREGWRSRNWAAYAIALALLAFYTALYFTDWLDPAARAFGLENKWLFYGALYSIAMVAGAVYYLRRHGNGRYNQVRIAVNVGVQICLAFTLPLVMPWFGAPEFYFSYLWPLDWYKLHPSTLEGLPVALALYSLLGSLIAAPILGFFLGKRWYCSWVCGCGGLANTAGDPWRHLTATSTASWRFEKVAVHSVLVIAVASTVLLAVDHVASPGGTFHWLIDGGQWWSMKRLYGYVVGAILAGVVGVGFYPLFGPRVWCRNFCPMAAVLGLVQKLGRFRITVKPDMCISCGNCSTYCEMGIDVRSYAQRNESFTRAACVGCGMCAHVCPRGVLKLENAKERPANEDRVRLPVV